MTAAPLGSSDWGPSRVADTLLAAGFGSLRGEGFRIPGPSPIFGDRMGYRLCSHRVARGVSARGPGGRSRRPPSLPGVSGRVGPCRAVVRPGPFAVVRPGPLCSRGVGRCAAGPPQAPPMLRLVGRGAGAAGGAPRSPGVSAGYRGATGGAPAFSGVWRGPRSACALSCAVRAPRPVAQVTRRVPTASGESTDRGARAGALASSSSSRASAPPRGRRLHGGGQLPASWTSSRRRSSTPPTASGFFLLF